MWHRIGVVDMAMDLDESRGESRENLPGGSSSALNLGPGKGGTAIRGKHASEIGDGSITFSASVR